MWLGFPFMMVVVLGALTSIPKDVLEAAEVDGATRWQRFRLVTLPLLGPVLLPAVVLGAVWTFNMFNVVFLVSGGEPDGTTDILVSEAYRWAFTRDNQYGYAAAYAVLIFLLLAGGSRIFGRKLTPARGRRMTRRPLEGRSSRTCCSSPRARSRSTRCSGSSRSRSRRPGPAAATARLLPLVSAPSLDNFRTVVGAAAPPGGRRRRRLFAHQLANSLVVSLATALVAIAVATPAAYALARFPFVGSKAGLRALLATQMFPTVASAVPLYLLLDALHLLDSRAGLILVYASTAVPFAIFQLRGLVPRHPGRHRGGRDGRRRQRARAFLLVVLPAARPAIAVTGALRVHERVERVHPRRDAALPEDRVHAGRSSSRATCRSRARRGGRSPRARSS